MHPRDNETQTVASTVNTRRQAKPSAMHNVTTELLGAANARRQPKPSLRQAWPPPSTGLAPASTGAIPFAGLWLAIVSGPMLVGFDVGGTNARALLVDADTGTILDRDRAPSTVEGPELVATLAGMVKRLGRRHNCVIDAIGLGVAGLAHCSGVVRYSPNLPLLIEFPIGPELSAATGLRVVTMNDATAATWAEARLGSGRGSDDFILITLGTGIGAGFVCGGHLIHGHNGFAGEAGHMIVDVDGPVHVTGARGPWEYFASGSRLGSLGRTEAAAGRFLVAPEIAGNIENIDGYTVAEALLQNDSTARRILDGFCGDVALGIANLVLIFDPQRVALGGGLTDIGEPLRTGVQQRLAQWLPGVAHRPEVKVVMAELGDDAGALGAALWAAHSAE